MRLWLLVALVACSSGQRPRDEPKPGPANTIPASALPAGECDDAPVIALEALANGAGAGERIALDVVPRAELTCTLLGCDRACCNSCGGGYTAGIVNVVHVRFTGIPGTCGGMDCSLRCEPFGLEPTTKYRFVGKNTFTPRGPRTALYDKVEFAVEKFCRI